MKTAFFSVLTACLLLAACGIDDSDKQPRTTAPVTQPQQTISAKPGTDSIASSVPGPGTEPTPEQILSYDQVADTVNVQVFRGLLLYKKTTGIFVDCATQKVFKVLDATQTLQGKYESFEADGNLLYVELVGKLSGSKDPAYTRLFRVTHMNKMMLKVTDECAGAKGIAEGLKRKS